MIHLKIEQIDGRTTLTIDDAELARLRQALGARDGDVLTADESAFSLESPQTEADKQLALAREAMTEYRETLDVLAR